MGTIEKAYFKLEDAAFKVEKANPGTDDASKKKVTDAWDAWNAESLKYSTKQTEMDGLNAQIKEMQGRLDARGAADQRASGASTAAGKVSNLEAGLTSKKGKADTLKGELAAIADKTSKDYKAKEKQFAEAQRAYDIESNNMTQLKAEAARTAK